MGQLDAPVQTAPADLGILTPAVWSLVARRSHMTLKTPAGEAAGVCVCSCVSLILL